MSKNCPVILRIEAINVVHKEIYFSLIVLIKSKSQHSKIEEPQAFFFFAVPKIKPGACVWQVPEFYLQPYKQEFLDEAEPQTNLISASLWLQS